MLASGNGCVWGLLKIAKIGVIIRSFPWHCPRSAVASGRLRPRWRGVRLGIEALESREMLSVAPLGLQDAVWAAEPPLSAASVWTHVAVSDDYGNTFGSATQLHVSTSTWTTKYASIEQLDDVDMFRFVAPVSGWVTISQKVRTGSPVDPHLYVYGSDLQLFADDDNGGGTRSSRLVVAVSAGATYYVQATGNGSTTGKYALNLRATRDDHGNTFSAATQLTLSTRGTGSKTASIQKPGDVDMFRLVAPISGVMTISQSAYYSQVNAFVSVYDGREQLLAEDDDSGSGVNARVAIEVKAGSTYYVAAAATHGTSGAYSLKFTTVASSSDDFGNTFASAAWLTLAEDGTGAQNGTIERAGDVDMFRLVAPVSGRMTVAQAIQGGSHLDSLVTIYNASGHLLASDDDSAGAQDAFATIQATAGSTYYVKAGAYHASTTGGYSLQISTDPNPSSGFRVDLVIVGMTTSQEQAFRQAAERWEQIIMGDVPDVPFRGGVYDDLVIRASAVAIDGPGGILGQAGPEGTRPGSMLPYSGMMEFDTADLAAMESGGTLLAVITHEMCHVLGFGTVWGSLGLLAGSGTGNPRFTGRLATAEYNALFGVSGSGVPVENTGGWGTVEAHWRESVFDNELMTGWIDTGRFNPLSRVTIASMADLGYEVNMSAADPFPNLVAPSAAGLSEGLPMSGTLHSKLHDAVFALADAVRV